MAYLATCAVPFSRNIHTININQTLHSKLNIDEPFKAVQVIDFRFFSFCSCINRHHSSWLLAYLPAIALKAAAECDGSDMHLIFSQLSLPFLTHFKS